MVAYTDLSRRDRMALAHVVQSFGSFSHAEDPKALAALSQSFATGTEVIPNRIPVHRAMELLAKEAAERRNP
jgi:hypothetical protein